MTQRTLAGLLAVPLLLALWVAAAFESLPYVTYNPGLTVNVLGEARRLYQRAGFVLDREERTTSYGHDLVHQDWRKTLSPPLR